MARYKKKNDERKQFVSTYEYKPEPIKALNERQLNYIRVLRGSDQVFAIGPAGTGKTFLAAATACDMLMNATVDKLIICRPTIGADEEIGFLPGGLNQKMQPWTVPFFDVVEERIGRNKMIDLQKNGKIEIVPLAYMRGRTFKKAWVMLDEAQNISPKQMKMFLTRLGEGSRVVVDGDLSQGDLKGESGLAVALDIIKKYELDIPVIEFGKDDIVRSGICAVWSEYWEKYNEANEQRN